MRGVRKPIICQVVGCTRDLSPVSNKYCRKKRACPEHLAAASVLLEAGGPSMRFCQQCGKYEPVNVFDGDKRSCRQGLLKRRSSEKRKQSTAAAAGGDACVIPTGPGGCQCTAADTACCTNSMLCIESCQNVPATADMYSHLRPEAPAQAAKRTKTEHCTAMPVFQQQLKQQLLWAAGQQRKLMQESFTSKDIQRDEVAPGFAVPHNTYSRARTAGGTAVTDLAAELEWDQLLLQQQQAAAVHAGAAAGYIPEGVRSNDTNIGGYMSTASLAPTPAVLNTKFTTNYSENALDALLDVLYEECAAEVAATASGGPAIEDPAAAVAAALQWPVNSGSLSAAHAVSYHAPGTMTAAAATPAAAVAVPLPIQCRLTAMAEEIAVLQAQLRHLQGLTTAVQCQARRQYCV